MFIAQFHTTPGVHVINQRGKYLLLVLMFGLQQAFLLAQKQRMDEDVYSRYIRLMISPSLREWGEEIINAQILPQFKAQITDMSKKDAVVMASLQSRRFLESYYIGYHQHSDKWIKEAILENYSEAELVKIVEWLSSPVGTKWLKFLRLVDSIGQEKAFEQCELTISEWKSIDTEFGSEATTSLQEKQNLVQQGLLTVITTHLASQNRLMIRRRRNDPFLFHAHDAEAIETSTERREPMAKRLGEMMRDMSNKSESPNELPRDEYDQMVDVMKAVKIYNEPMPCEMYLCKWGSTIDVVKKKADDLNMLLLKDSVGAAERILIYSQIRLHFNNSGEYYRISSEVYEPILGNMSSEGGLTPHWFSEAWQVIDAPTMSAFGICEDLPGKAVIHSKFRNRGIVRHYVECLDLIK